MCRSVRESAIKWAGTMGHRYDAAEFEELTAWARQVAAELGVEPLKDDDVDMVLSAAAQVSAGLVRSAAPVAMYLAGYLVAVGQATDVAIACRMADRLMTDPGADQED